jgi:hypothetical protein
MDKPETLNPPQAHWQDALDEADADVAAGRVIWPKVHAMLREHPCGDAPVPPDAAR